MIQNIVQIFMQWDGIKSIKKSYWLASRNDDTSVSITYFGTRYMTANGQVGMNLQVTEFQVQVIMQCVL